MTRHTRLWTLCGALFSVALAGCGTSTARGPDANSTDAQKIRDKLVSATKVAGGGEKTEPVAKSKFDGWATLKGRFVLDGAAPAPVPLTIDKDEAVCGGHGLVDQSLEVGPTGGIADVVVWVHSKLKANEINPEFAKTADATVLLDNHECHFVPHVVGLRVGQTLEIKNSDPVSHNTKISGTNTFNELIRAGTSTKDPINDPENLPAPVACSIHPWMHAALVVRPNPYFAISDKDGNFEIKDLPAGELEFQVWQENASSLSLKRPDLNWNSKGLFKVTLHKGEVRDLKDLSVPVALLQAH